MSSSCVSTFWAHRINTRSMGGQWLWQNPQLVTLVSHNTGHCGPRQRWTTGGVSGSQISPRESVWFSLQDQKMKRDDRKKKGRKKESKALLQTAHIGQESDGTIAGVVAAPLPGSLHTLTHSWL